MNIYDVKRLAEVLAVQAEIEGMRAANAERMGLGESMAYNENNFIALATELRTLASKPDEEL